MSMPKNKVFLNSITFLIFQKDCQNLLADIEIEKDTSEKKDYKEIEFFSNMDAGELICENEEFKKVNNNDEKSNYEHNFVGS